MAPYNAQVNRLAGRLEPLGVPVGTVRSRLFRARRLMQEALLDHARDAGLVLPALPVDSTPKKEMTS